MSKFKFNGSLEKIINNSLGGYTELVAQQKLKDLADKMQIEITNFLKNHYYNDYRNRVYKRTENLLKSVTTTKIEKTKNGYSITVFLDPSKYGDYNNSMQKRFYVRENGNIVYPKVSQEYSSTDVFHLASQGIHGLPRKSLDGNWENTNFYQSDKNLNDFIETKYDTDMLLSEFSKHLKSQGFEVKKL